MIWIEWLLLAGVAFIPCLWFRHGTLLASVDTLLPQSWDRTMELLQVWNHRIGTGAIYTFDVAAWVFDLVPATVLRWGGSMRLAQQVEFCVWYGLAGWAIYLMMRLLYRGPHPVIARLAAVGFYVCNFYLAPIWTSFNKSNIALYAVLPLLTAGYVQVLWRLWKVWPGLGVVALISVGASAVGTNTSLVGIAVIAWAAVTAAALLDAAWRRAFRDLGRRALLAAALVILLIGVHAFWILPQLMVTLPEVPQSSLPEARAQALAWNEGISRHASVFNVLRLQGDWTWYTGHGEPYVLYAARYLEHPWWIILSWFLVALVALGVLAPRLQFRGVFLAVMAAGLLGSMGTYPPTGWLFRWAINHVPGFWMFRSAWFKFMLLTCVGYSFFIGAGVAWLAQRLHALQTQRVAAGALAAIVLYASPVLTGAMFPTAAERRTLPPLHVSVPAYVEEAVAWFQRQPPNGRIFCLPGRDVGVWANRWGYGGSMPYLWYRIPQPLVYALDPLAQMMSHGAPRVEAALVRFARQSVNSFQGQLTPRLDRVLRLLGVQFLMHEGDFRYELLPQADHPEAMRARLQAQRGLSLQRTFGPWEVYAVEDPRPLFMTVPSVVAAWGDPSWMTEVAQTPLADHQVVWWVDAPSAPQIRDLLNRRLVSGLLIVGQAAEGLPEVVARDPALPVTVLVASRRSVTAEQLNRTPDLSLIPHGIAWRWADGVTVDAAQDWAWLVPGEASTIVLDNPYLWPVTTTVHAEVVAVERPRVLYPYINGVLIHLDDAAVRTTCPVGTVPQRLVLPAVTLQPGRNLLRFYTVEPWIRQGEQLRSFGIRHVAVGDPLLRIPATLPRPGPYRVRLSPQYEGALTGRDRAIFATRTLQIGGRPVSLSAVQDADGLWLWEASSVPMPAGPVTIEATPLWGEHWVLELANGPEAPSARAWQPVAIHRRSPTRHEIAFSLTQPGILVFNESFHPGWTAEAWPHLQVNGFANAWVVPAGQHEVAVAFAPQRWARWGQRVSVAVGLGILIGIAVTGLWRWGRRRVSHP